MTDFMLQPSAAPLSPEKLSPVHRKKPTFSKKYLPLVLLLVLGMGAVGVLSSQQWLQNSDQSGRVAAVSSNGTATLTLQPAAKTFTPGEKATVQLVLNAGQSPIDGVQVLANLAGQVPTDLAFQQSVPAGLQGVTNEVVTSVTQPQFKLAMVTTDPSASFVNNNQPVVLGVFTFTAPSSGNFQVSFDPTLTRVVQHAAAQDILKMPAIGQYQFGTIGVSPTPSATPVASAMPIPSPSIVASPSPVPSPTAVPVSMVVLQATWREWPYRWNQLTIKIGGSIRPPATIEVVGFGKLNYNKRTKTYGKTFYTNQKPTTVVVRASTGQEMTVPVDIKKFGQK